MKKRCIVHIGMHKTGSSSIQETLNNYLEDSNYYYVKLNSPNHSSDIISLFSTTPENNHNYQKRGLNKVDIDNINQKVKTKLIENFKEIQIDNFIISGEGIIHLSEKELRVFKDFLYTYFEEITIVGYIRSPWSYMESTFQQQLKGTLNRFNPLNLYPRYKEKFEKFDFVFGRKNVQLWKFDPKSFIGGDVVLDFCHRLGVHIDSNQIIRINEALSKEATSLLYIYRKHGPGYGVGQNVIRENEKMIGSLAKIGNTKLKFSSTLIKDILNKNKEDLEWMENRIGSSLRETRIENQYDIVSEKDLLEVSQEVLEELKKIIGKVHFPAGLTGDTLNEIAISIDILRKKTLKVANNRDMNECQAKDVLVGNDDYLFLCGGNHNIKIFFTGVVEPTLKSIDNFWSNIKIRKTTVAKRV